MNTEHRRAIARHGEALYPQACHGVLLGNRNGTMKEVVDLVFLDSSMNAEGHGYRYQIPAEELTEVEEEAKVKDLEIIGSFHSHVDEPARPSIHDREHAQPTFTYVIVGVRQGRAHELAAWKLSEDGTAFYQEDIRST
jgi:proteasome lid subunit RPN8/RPN11